MAEKTTYIELPKFCEDVNDTLHKVVDVLRIYESKAVKSERTQLQTFSYLLKYCDDTRNLFSEYKKTAEDTSKEVIKLQSEIQKLNNAIFKLKTEKSNTQVVKKDNRYSGIFGFIYKFIDKRKEKQRAKQQLIEQQQKEEEERLEKIRKEKEAEEQRKINRANSQKQISSIINSMPKPNKLQWKD